MVRTLERRVFSENKDYVNIACLADDDKPVGNFVTGSLCLEVDTGAQFAFDEVAGQWNQISAGYTAPDDSK